MSKTSSGSRQLADIHENNALQVPIDCEALFAPLMSTPDLVSLYDRDDRLLTANPAYCNTHHCDPADHPYWSDVMRANYWNRSGPIIETEDIEAWLLNASARRATVPYRSFEAALHGGTWIWVTETVSPDGKLLLHASDITSLRVKSRPLRLERDTARRAAWTDPLTGVPNRRYIMEQFARWALVQRHLPERGVHSLAVLDLDCFKAINDTFGHGFGDSVLKSFCRDVVSFIRPLDLFGRIGGEEFLLLMPHCTVDIAQDRLNELQQKIGRPPAAGDQLLMRYSFSAGLVEVRLDEDIHETIRLADKMLYAAKEAGRARVHS